MESSSGSLSCSFVCRPHHEEAGHRAQGWIVSGHPGAGTDEQVAADGAGVCNLALTNGGGTHASPSLAQLVDLVHDTAQVTTPILVQTGRHGQRNGGGRYSNVWWGICVRKLPWSITTQWGLLEASGCNRGSCTCRLGKRL